MTDFTTLTLRRNLECDFCQSSFYTHLLSYSHKDCEAVQLLNSAIPNSSISSSIEPVDMNLTKYLGMDYNSVRLFPAAELHRCGTCGQTFSRGTILLHMFYCHSDTNVNVESNENQKATIDLTMNDLEVYAPLTQFVLIFCTFISCFLVSYHRGNYHLLLLNNYQTL